MQLIPLLKLCYHQFINHWAWFALSAVVCGCIGWYYQQCQPRVYQRQAVMLIEDSNGSSTGGLRRTSKNSGMNTLLELNGVSVGDNLKNEIFIISSKRLMSRVVDAHGLRWWGAYGTIWNHDGIYVLQPFWKC